MTVKELLIKFQEYQLEYKVLNLNCAHNAVANLFMERKQIENCTIHGVSNSADVNKDKGHGICKEDGCEKFAVIDYNGHGHWNCQSCYDRNERYFEANYD